MQQGNVAVQVVDALAGKLAVPAAQLWAVLVREVPIEIGKDVLLLAVLAGATFGLMRWWRYALADPGPYSDRQIPVFLASCLTAVAAGLVIFATITDLGYLFNPQYFALHEILSAIHGK